MEWLPAPPELRLEEGEVDVWRASLVVPSERLAELRSWLAPDELARADRFRFEIHRDRFTAGRGLLRRLLARYVDRAPAELTFGYGPNGKPFLTGPAAIRGVCFNASHSGDLALYAVRLRGEVGVDLEQHKAEVEFDRLARRFFSPAEVSALMALAPEERPAAFFRCWSRKEAYIKALGTGLALPLDQFDMSLAPNEPAALLRTQHDPEAVHRWKVWTLEPGADYSGALVAESTVRDVRCWGDPLE